ncbi:hypothetical protein M758_9G141400 [Ceratodon purpureus]|nr:hypothetical protein M758_9G141400 [Ceratodon purpureus]
MTSSGYKMHFLWVLVLLSAVVAASGARPISSSREAANTTRLSLCAAASNCETYETEHGTMIRFASGMGPGSAHHARMLASSSDQDKTVVTLGTNFINYGTTGASGTYGAIHHLYDMCHEGACDSSPFEVDTILASDVAEQDAKLVLTADGHYDGWGERDAYVEAVLVAAAQGESCKRQTWTQYGPNGQIYETGTRQQCSQTSFISVDKWCNEKKNLKGYIQVKVAIDQSSTLASCSKVTGVFASIISMVGAIAGPYAEAAGAASGFFGVVSAACG